MSDRRVSAIIRTAHGARVRYDHGDNCTECRALGPEAERDALRAVVRRLRAGRQRDYTTGEWWRLLYPEGREQMQTEPMTDAERSALMAAEVSGG